MARWSDWRQFPDFTEEGYLYVYVGPGVYELRNRETGELVLVGESANLAYRIMSLLPERCGGVGTRRNERKREYVAAHRWHIDYRTRTCATKAGAQELERRMRRDNEYIFPT